MESSKNSFVNTRCTLSVFYDIIGKSIIDVTTKDIKKYVDFLDSRYSNRSTKRNNVVRVKAYYHHVLKKIGEQGILKADIFKYIDIGFLKKERFKQKEGFKVNLAEFQRSKAIPDDVSARILAAARIRSQRLHVLFLILKHTGMRVSEAITIRIDNIDLERRVVSSGTVKNYAKESVVIHPFPAHVGMEIKKLIATLKDGETWLFPGHESHVKQPQSLIKAFKKATGIGRWTSHQFRHALVTKRSLIGCPKEVNEFLQNHAPSGTQDMYYKFRNYTIEDRVALYDEWNPYAEE